MIQAPKNERMLVIDDNRAIHDDFRKILSRTGSENTTLDQAEAVLFGEQAPQASTAQFEIDSAYQGQEGLALVQRSIQEKNPYALAFVDVRMPPGWDGVETMQKLWEADPDLQVVICTAYSDYSWDEMIGKVGSSDRFLILKKPFDAVEVLQLANALTEKWRLQQEVRRQVGELERKVAERTKELQATNENLQLEVSERKQAEESLRIKTAQLQAITDAAVAFLQSGDERLSSELLLRSALAQTTSECGFIAIVTDDSRLRVLAHVCVGLDQVVLERILEDVTDDHGQAENPKNAALRNLFRTVVSTGKSAIVNEMDTASASFEGPPLITASSPCFFGVSSLNPDGTKAADTCQRPLRSFMGMPILNATQVVGVIGVANRPEPYTSREQNKVAVMARAAGVLFDSYRRQQREVFLEEQLRQSQKVEAIGRLAGGVAHDFNNILTAILGYSQLMLVRIRSGDPLRGNVEEIRKAAERAAGLTRQLLAFSRKQILEPKIVNLNDVLCDLGKMLRRTISEDIELVTVCAKDLGRVKVDPSQIEQVIINLAVNARDAMTHGGKLMITTGNVALDGTYASRHGDVMPGNYVILTVSDTGVGMTAQVQARLFEPFFTTKAQGKGTGLGLATCYGIIKQSGGHITVYSEPGHGTDFKIYLPRVEEPASTCSKQDASFDLPHGTEKVLIVEDEPALRQLASLVLQELGYTVMEAANGRDALDVVRERNGGGIDLVMTDVVMPRMGGKELADHIRHTHPGTKILFNSGYTEDTIVHHGILDDGVAFMHKPYTPDVLARKVREVLDSPASELHIGKSTSKTG